jgi:hypothetical protein
VFRHIADAYNLKLEDLQNQSQLSAISECRKQSVYRCCRIIGYSPEEVAGYFKISSPAVSGAIKSSRELIRKEDVGKFIKVTPG